LGNPYVGHAVRCVHGLARYRSYDFGFLLNEGAKPALKTPAELGSYVAAEMAKWVQFARIASIRGE
jgi:hypothetical protein